MAGCTFSRGEFVHRAAGSLSELSAADEACIASAWTTVLTWRAVGQFGQFGKTGFVQFGPHTGHSRAHADPERGH